MSLIVTEPLIKPKTTDRLNSTPSFAASRSSLLWLALGTFAVGTESFMISPLLPKLASDLSVSLTAAGQLVTAFALTYALSSPVLTALTGNIGRRKLLIFSMLGFALANVVACTATGYGSLMLARILLAAAAGLYVPNSNALAGALVPPERRGGALAIVNGGITVAIALGVPLGAVVGHRFGWRMTFVGVGALALIATAGLIFGLKPGVGAGIPVASLRARMAVARRPVILAGLLVTTLWAMGTYTIYTYITPFASTVGIQGGHLSAILFLWGIAAAAGLFTGGNLNDRFGARAIILPALLLMTLAFWTLSGSATFLPAHAIVPVLIALVAWAASAWAFYPAQQSRLIGIAGVQVAPVALSLNASFMYLGFSLGALFGSFVMNHASAASLGWAGSLCTLAALGLILWTTRRAARPAAPV